MSAVLGARPSVQDWRATLPLLAVALAGVLLLYRDSFAGMVEIWSRSDTFAHAFLVAPISLYLVWRRRAELAALRPVPQPTALLLMLPVAFGWLVGHLAGVNALVQLTATALLVLCVPALAGWSVTRAIAFPLGFLFFMVPIGEFLMPLFMRWTADFTVTSLRLIGVPVYREGLNFVIPSGNWSVVEACSGIRYLIASLMVGTLFAYLQYRSTARRLVFVAVSIVVPVVANWLRALMIVLLGHYSDNRLAAGVDHLVYGWVFFGIVIAVMFLVGARWSEPEAAPAGGAAAAKGASGASAARWAGITAALVALVLAAPHAAVWRLDGPTPPVALDWAALAGSRAVVAEDNAFRPHFEGAAALGQARLAGDPAVELHVAYYRRQGFGRKLASSENVLVRSEDRQWRIVSQGTATIDVAGRPVPTRTAVLRAGALSQGEGGGRTLLVRQVLWSGDRLTARNAEASLFAVGAQLLGRGDDAAALTFTLDAADTADGQRQLDAAVARHLDAVVRWLSTTRGAAQSSSSSRLSIGLT